jgi:hypothetical protein
VEESRRKSAHWRIFFVENRGFSKRRFASAGGKVSFPVTLK